MKPYTFFKHDGSSVPPSFDLGEFDDDEAAAAHARDLLAHAPQYHAVEVWDGTSAPFTVARTPRSAQAGADGSQPPHE
jgi:hypothetical protein